MSNKKNLIFFTLQSVSAIAYPVITFPYASKMLGPEGIGLANFADSVCKYFMLFAALGVPIYGLREIAKYDGTKEKDLIFSEILIINILSTFACLIVYFLLIYTNQKFWEHSNLYLLGGLYIFSNIFSIEWYFNGIGDFKFVAIRSIVIRFLSIGGLFIFVNDTNDTYWYFFLNVVALLANNLINLFFWRIRGGKLVLSKLNLKRHFRPMFYIFSSTIAISVYVLIDTIILGFIKSDIYVGYYSLSSKLNKIPLALVVAYGTVILPKLSKLSSENKVSEFQKLIKNSFAYVFLIGIPVGYFIVINAEDIILSFANNTFMPAYASMKIMSVLSLLIGLSNIFGLQILTPQGKEKEFLYCVLIGTFSSLLLNLLLIPSLNDIGASIANVLSELAVTLSTGYFAMKYVKFRFPYQMALRQLVYYLPFVIINLFFDSLIEDTYARLMASVLLFAFGFILINIVLYPSKVVQEVYKNIKINI